ncbi:MAG TPA: slipin family protein [Leptospiraceae bacterium]|nr:slipin family protein [Leptospiraceae bacterium]HNO21590.1 slipin family protein [Leptospiraceae bacterium]
MRNLFPMYIEISQDQRGFLFRKGQVSRLLLPGRYFLFDFLGEKAEVHSLYQKLNSSVHLNTILSDSKIASQLETVEVKDYEICLFFRDGILTEVLQAGKHSYWKTSAKLEFRIYDRRTYEIPPEIDRNLLTHPLLVGFVTWQIVESYEVGLYYVNREFKRILSPNLYYFWQNSGSYPEVRKSDTRIQALDISGQEIMTEEKVTLRLNFTSQYKIKDHLKVHSEIQNLGVSLYTEAQLVLREFISTKKLDDVLQRKDDIGNEILKILKSKEDVFGVQFISAGIRDIILPGEMKDILNTVLIAEKKAQANLITRREETASTRSLLNTAKLLDDNPTLMKLKELEYLEKILEKIGSVNLSTSSGLLEQLTGLLEKSRQG